MDFIDPKDRLLCLGIVADDVVICVADCNALVRLDVGDWGFEE